MSVSNIIPCPSDAVIDLTMISTAEVTNVNHFSISCINGERSPAKVELDIRRDNKILIIPKKPNFKVHKGTKEAVARDFRELDHVGIFYCESTQEVPPLETATMINNFGSGGLRTYTTEEFLWTKTKLCLSYLCPFMSVFLVAKFLPTHLTLTANKGETVHLGMQLLGSEKRDVTWKYNGKPLYTSQDRHRKYEEQLTHRVLIKDLNNNTFYL